MLLTKIYSFVFSFSDRKREFKKANESLVDLLNTFYDYTSIMHYGAYAFSKNAATKTIVTTRVFPNLGRDKKLSDKDVLRLRKYYNCGEFDYGEVIRCPLKTVDTIGIIVKD